MVIKMKKLLNSLDIETGKICISGNTRGINVLTKSHKRFFNVIGFTHKKKMKRLENRVKHLGQKYDNM